MSIDPREISVVVQGPITGRPTDPPQQQLTRLCLEGLRRHLPGADRAESHTSRTPPPAKSRAMSEPELPAPTTSTAWPHYGAASR